MNPSRDPTIQPSAPPGNPPASGAGRRYLHDLPVPPELKEAIEAYCRHYPYRSKRIRQSVEEQFKLQYFFGGSDVALLSTPAGKAVIAVGDYTSEEFGKILDALNREERRRVVLLSPRRWDDDTSEILTPYSADD